jgi:hypothetical protein
MEGVVVEFQWEVEQEQQWKVEEEEHKWELVQEEEEH